MTEEELCQPVKCLSLDNSEGWGYPGWRDGGKLAILWQRHKLWNQTASCANPSLATSYLSDAWSSYLDTLCLSFLLCRLEPTTHRAVVRINKYIYTKYLRYFSHVTYLVTFVPFATTFVTKGRTTVSMQRWKHRGLEKLQNLPYIMELIRDHVEGCTPVMSTHNPAGLVSLVSCLAFLYWVISLLKKESDGEV